MKYKESILKRKPKSPLGEKPPKTERIDPHCIRAYRTCYCSWGDRLMKCKITKVGDVYLTEPLLKINQ